MTEVTYNEFRGLHKGMTQKKVSKLWKKYKDGKYQLPQASPPAPEITVPVGVVEVNIKPGEDSSYGTEDDEVTIRKLGSSDAVKSPPKAEAPEPVDDDSPSPLKKCNEYERYRRELRRFSYKYNEEETKKIQARMKQFADETRPEGYFCEPTDSWKIWFGPTRECLLINTTRQLAFKVDRDWWKDNYQTTIYVDRELLNDPTHIETEKMRYARKGKYLPRTPIVGLECKLPQTVKDIQMRGGHAGDR